MNSHPYNGIARIHSEMSLHFVQQVSIPIENTIVQNVTHLVNFTYTGLYNGIETFKANLYSDYGQDYSAGKSDVTFAIVFGVLFSGVTGKE